MNDLLTERRDLAIDRLSTGYADGALEVDELERRLARAQEATTPGELDALVSDLAATTALVTAAPMRILFGSIERVGPWAVPAQVTARVTFGSLVLDLREARLAPSGATLDLRVTMGSVEVIVPPGVDVEVAASSFLGSVEERLERGLSPRSGVVRIVGAVRLGSLEVSTRRPGETARDARRRRRIDRRLHRRFRRCERHALPAPWEW